MLEYSEDSDEIVQCHNNAIILYKRISRKIKQSKKRFAILGYLAQSYVQLALVYSQFPEAKITTQDLLNECEQLGVELIHWQMLATAVMSTCEYLKAQIVLRRIIEIFPTDINAHHSLAVAYRKLEGYDDALRQYLRVIELDDGNVDALFQASALLVLQEEDYESALAYAKKCTELAPDHVEIWNLIGVIYNNLRAFDLSEQAYQKQLKLTPDDPVALNNYGSMLLEIPERFSDAAAILWRSVEMRPAYKAPWYNLGRLYDHDIETIPLALHCLKKCVEIDENNIRPWNLLGNIYKDELNLHDKAESFYKIALTINPDDPIPLNNYGDLLMSCDNLEEAEKKLMTSVLRDPKYGIAWFNLGRLYKKQGKLSDAFEAFSTSLKLEPNRIGTWVVLASCYEPDKLDIDRSRRYGSPDQFLEKIVALSFYDANSLRVIEQEASLFAYWITVTEKPFLLKNLWALPPLSSINIPNAIEERISIDLETASEILTHFQQKKIWCWRSVLFTC